MYILRKNKRNFMGKLTLILLFGLLLTGAAQGMHHATSFDDDDNILVRIEKQRQKNFEECWCINLLKLIYKLFHKRVTELPLCQDVAGEICSFLKLHDVLNTSKVTKQFKAWTSYYLEHVYKDQNPTLFVHTIYSKNTLHQIPNISLELVKYLVEKAHIASLTFAFIDYGYRKPQEKHTIESYPKKITISNLQAELPTLTKESLIKELEEAPAQDANEGFVLRELYPRHRTTITCENCDFKETLRYDKTNPNPGAWVEATHYSPDNPKPKYTL
jgi:hypothetical protein